MAAPTSALAVAVAQFNAVLGDLAGNRSRLADLARQAQARGADLMLSPELGLCGYPPEDLLLRPDFYRACARELELLAAEVPEIGIVVGHPLEVAGQRYNAASYLKDGRIQATYRKHRLPNYEVFDEERYFEAGSEPCLIEVKGWTLGLNICADVWEAGAAEQAAQAGAQALLVLNASPYHMNKEGDRLAVLRERVAATRIPLIYNNLVGGQDELVFDGASLALCADGSVGASLPRFEEALELLQLTPDGRVSGLLLPEPALEEQVYRALVLGVRDYIGKNGFKGAVIGLSGGIDSALTLVVAAEAQGADKVRAVMMPSPYTAQMSLDDSRQLVETLGVRYDEIAIAPAMGVYGEMLAQEFAGTAADTTEENLQARIRGNILMAISNKSGSLVLTTGNKSEMAVGYCTLYGDMAGGFAVIKDLAKTFVYRLCRWINREREIIPDNIIVRPPSAELKPDQKDQDSLPPYEVLDAIMEAYMEQDLSPREIVAQGYAEADVRRVVRLLKISEYKRRQAPVGIRVTQRGFGKDWRYPITNRYADEW